MNNITIEDIKKAYNKLGYQLFEQDDKPFNLNLIGIRSKDTTPDVFNDIFLALWKDKGIWSQMAMYCTTEAGLYYLKNPLNNKGTAIVKEGQYPGVWELGMHQGKYQALCQKKPITVIRDFDRDGEFDYDSGREETGLFGINCHRSNSNVESILVNKWSAGCQVIANPDEYKILMKLCEYSSHEWGNSFTYTLINEDDL